MTLWRAIEMRWDELEWSGFEGMGGHGRLWKRLAEYPDQ